MRPPYVPQIRLYQDWLKTRRGLVFDSYTDLHRWSVTHLDDFWQSIWDYFELQSPSPHTSVVRGQMPDAVWFSGAQVNYAAQVFRHAEAAHAAGLPAIVSHDESSLGDQVAAHTTSWLELRQQVAGLALHITQSNQFWVSLRSL